LDREIKRARGILPVQAYASVAPPFAASEVAAPPEASLSPEETWANGESWAPAAEGNATEAGEAALPVVVAFAEFDPPESTETQMLALRPGDEIVALGQDGQGWWYGRKTDGSEGWFPPLYVQLKEEFENAAAAAAASAAAEPAATEAAPQAAAAEAVAAAEEAAVPAEALASAPAEG